MAEKCVADASTKAGIPGTDLAFVPPKNWLFAQEAEVTLAQTPDGGPCLAMTSFEGGSDKAIETGRQAGMDVMLRSLGLQLPEPKKKGQALIDWKKPDSAMDVGEHKVDLWQIEGGDRASIKGSVLVIRFQSAARTVLATGFVPSDDKSDADKAIMNAFETITTVEKPDGEESDAKRKGDDEGS